MDLDADCYLPGTVRETAGGPVLARSEGSIPLADPDGHLSGRDGQRCTVGVDVAEPSYFAADDESAGVRREGEGVVLVGRRRSLDTKWERPVSRVEDLTFDRGCWPVDPAAAATRTRGSRRARPLRAVGREDRVRIDAESLSVASVLADPDPYGAPIADVRLEFHRQGGRSRLTVPGLPVWANHGWLGGSPERFVEFTGKWARFAVEASYSPNQSYPPMDERHDFEYDVDGDVLRVKPVVSTVPLGILPREGLAFDREAFARAWIRDAKTYLAGVPDDEAGSVRDLVETVASAADLAGVEPRSLATSPGEYGTEELRTIARDDPADRRDAVAELGARESESATGDLAALLAGPKTRGGPGLDDGSEPPIAAPVHGGDRWVVADALGRIGGVDAAEALVDLVEADPDPGVRGVAHDALESLPAAVVSAALLARASVGAGSDSGDSPSSSHPHARSRPGSDEAARLVRLLETGRRPGIRKQAARTLAATAGRDAVEDLFAALVEEPDAGARNRIADAIRSVDGELDAIRERTDDAVGCHHRTLRLLSETDGETTRRELSDLVPVEGRPDRSQVLAALEREYSPVRELACIGAAEFVDDPPYDALFEVVAAPEDRPEYCRKRGAEAIAALVARGADPPDPRRLFERYRDAVAAGNAGRGGLRGALREMGRRYDGGDFFGVDPTWVIATYHAAIVEDEEWVSPMAADDVMESIVAHADHDRLLAEMADDPERRFRVAKLLARGSTESILSLLTAMLADDHPDVADAALESLLEVGAEFPVDAIDGDPAEDNRILAAYAAFAEEAHEDGDHDRFEAAVAPLLAATDAEAWHCRAKATRAVAPCIEADRVRDRLVTLARSDPDSVVRRVAVHALSRRRDDRTRAVLIDLLDASDGGVRAAAASALGSSFDAVGETPPKPQGGTVGGGDTTDGEGQQSRDAGGGAGDAPPEAVVEALANRLPTADRRLWQSILETLWPAAGREQVARELSEALAASVTRNEDPTVRRTALETLVEVHAHSGLDGRPVLEAAADALGRDGDRSVRTTAATVLVRIGSPRADDELDEVVESDP